MTSQDSGASYTSRAPPPLRIPPPGQGGPRSASEGEETPKSIPSRRSTGDSFWGWLIPLPGSIRLSLPGYGTLMVRSPQQQASSEGLSSMPWGQAMLGAKRLPLQPEAGQSASACLGWIIKSWLSDKAVSAAQVELLPCSRPICTAANTLSVFKGCLSTHGGLMTSAASGLPLTCRQMGDALLF